MSAASQTLSDAFRNAFRCHPAGVAVITATHEGKPYSMTVSSLISVSANPPIVGFSLSSASSAAQPVLNAQSIVIHMLSYNDLGLAQLGATKGADRFDGSEAWEFLPSGEPRYTKVQTWFRARKVNQMQVDGAVVVAAQLLEGASPSENRDESESLIYMDRRWLRLREKIETR